MQTIKRVGFAACMTILTAALLGVYFGLQERETVSEPKTETEKTDEPGPVKEEPRVEEEPRPPHTEGQPMTAEQAARFALRQSGGGRVKKLEVKEEEGRKVYEIEVQTDHGREAKWLIDAGTGEILKAEMDDD